MTTFTDDGVEWTCGGCNERTIKTHWRHGADGVMFHAGSDAPPSDEYFDSVHNYQQPDACDCYVCVDWVLL